ncbi:MAG: hypothetical protein PHT79_04780 [Syntrophomonadaceae bacterium]|nr:hypothetical protein [Syntrophomonadaceae bacterium]MDD3890374.1 hypothetical protein [Syntrophomonadaceae bacterium]MDD4549056.1 hypothetical protein [Syntrophomonadaceae bacterium]
MKKSKLFKVSMLLMLGVFLLGAAVPAMADATNTAAAPNGPGNSFQQKAQNMVKTLGDLTGMDINDIRAERQAGKSILDIAKEKGVSEDALAAKITGQNQARLKDRLDNGTITQDQYNQCLQNMDQRVKERLERTTTGGFGMGRRGADGQAAQRGQGGFGQRGQGCGACPYAQAK